MKQCIICGEDFAPRLNTKTCSVKCSGALRLRRDKQYNHDRAFLAGVYARRRDAKDFKAAIRFDRKINRAVHLLFRLTGDHTT